MKIENGYCIWNKNEDEALSPHFTTLELQCKCSNDSCQEQRISVELIQSLEIIRQNINIPIKITSGYRCHAKQEELRAQGLETAKGISQHELGNAADVKCDKMWLLEEECLETFKAVGIANSFIHIDTRKDRIRHWDYK